MYCCVFPRQRDKKLCVFSDLNECFYWTLTIYTHKYNYSTLDVPSPMLQLSCTVILGEESSLCSDLNCPWSLVGYELTPTKVG
jgi:hypothetical protein